MGDFLVICICYYVYWKHAPASHNDKKHQQSTRCSDRIETNELRICKSIDRWVTHNCGSCANVVCLPGFRLLVFFVGFSTGSEERPTGTYDTTTHAVAGCASPKIRVGARRTTHGGHRRQPLIEPHPVWPQPRIESIAAGSVSKSLRVRWIAINRPTAHTFDLCWRRHHKRWTQDSLDSNHPPTQSSHRPSTPTAASTGPVHGPFRPGQNSQHSGDPSSPVAPERRTRSRVTARREGRRRDETTDSSWTVCSSSRYVGHDAAGVGSNWIGAAGISSIHSGADLWSHPTHGAPHPRWSIVDSGPAGRDAGPAAAAAQRAAAAATTTDGDTAA